VKGPEEFTLNDNNFGTPVWPDGGSRPPSVAHQCPPDRVAMLQNLTELEHSFRERLTNQTQVIKNLSEVVNAKSAQLDAWHRFGKYVASLEPGVFGGISEKARDLLAQQGEAP
jgi:hypothetical protein